MQQGWAGRKRRWGNRLAARAVRSAPAAGGFTSMPEPRTVGFFAKGRQLAQGNFLLAGHMLETHTPWAVELPSAGFAAELHGMGWLDHLAAAGDRPARLAAQGWIGDWITHYGKGKGPGWQPDLTGRRVLRWLHHAIFLTAGQDADGTMPFFAALGRQTAFLARRWKAADPGLPRFEALTGLLYAAYALIGMERYRDEVTAALARACAEDIAADGGLASRNPEDLLEVFTLLTWALQALQDAEATIPPALESALSRIAPCLRALRHADGGLARFHGGGRGMEGRLDHALSAANVPVRPNHSSAMGFARLEGGRSTLLVDAAAPPGGLAAHRAHASMLAFELTSNRRPLVVSSGSGLPFGPEWEKAGRATNSHSTLSIDGWSSARFGRTSRPEDGGAPLVEGPALVTRHRTDERDGSSLLLSHDGYVPTHGLTHVRTLSLDHDGRSVLGEDTLAALEPAHRKTFEALLNSNKMRGIAYALRFHLHPDADPSLDMNGSAVSVALPSGELWVFRFDGPGRLSLEPSVYLEKGRLAPRPCQQIVVRAVILDETSQINWTLAKAQDTPLAIRDIGRDDDLALPRDLFAFD
ncbi:heparinase II/III family protein [Pararhodobacter zhoushanensis]|uniref:heparinase II/III family protein n=1 Tax=Pararhodobacter zhoushanensis TaxID=2479545 RepID=UPI000F8DBCB9|nr:heparinase II/III family protein [Pararhodobacter zhoushanensis]